MTREQYLKKRNELLAQAQTHLDAHDMAKFNETKTEIEKYLGKGILVSVEDNDTLIYEYSFSNKNYPSFPIDYQFFYKDTILSSIVVNFINF